MNQNSKLFQFMGLTTLQQSVRSDLTTISREWIGLTTAEHTILIRECNYQRFLLTDTLFQ